MLRPRPAAVIGSMIQVLSGKKRGEIDGGLFEDGVLLALYVVGEKMAYYNRPSGYVASLRWVVQIHGLVILIMVFCEVATTGP